jgi:hypothetical protein
MKGITPVLIGVAVTAGLAIGCGLQTPDRLPGGALAEPNGSTVPPEPSPPIPEQPLSLTAAMPNQPIWVMGGIRPDVTFRNGGHRELIVCKPLAGSLDGGFDGAESFCEPRYAVQLFDANGKEVRPDPAFPFCSLGAGNCSTDDFIRLKPSESRRLIGRQGSSPLAVWAGRYQLRPDTPYTIRARYRMTDRAKLTGFATGEEKRALEALYLAAHRCDISSPLVPVIFTSEPVTDEDKKMAAEIAPYLQPKNR